MNGKISTLSPLANLEVKLVGNRGPDQSARPLNATDFSEADQKRFWGTVNKDGPTMPHMETPCWMWEGSTYGTGYGRFFLKGNAVKAHRASFVLSGEKPLLRLALHDCDNRMCVNPAHIYEGTNADNTDDRTSRGRHQNFIKTHCKRGHPLSGDNMKIRFHPQNKPWRECQACKAIFNERRRPRLARALGVGEEGE